MHVLNNLLLYIIKVKHPSKHPKSLKDSILHSQAALRIKPICTTPNDFSQHCEELKQRFVNLGYKPELINKHTKAAEKMDRKEI